MTRRMINREGLELVKQFEGCRLTAYKCPAGVWTIGYGSTGSHVKPGKAITQDMADELLRSDLRRFEDGVAEMAPESTENQYSALVSFAFNLGLDALKKSTLLRLHNEGDCTLAAQQFGRWIRAGGRILPGLVRRRNAEAALYAKADA